MPNHSNITIKQFLFIHFHTMDYSNNGTIMIIIIIYCSFSIKTICEHIFWSFTKTNDKLIICFCETCKLQKMCSPNDYRAFKEIINLATKQVTVKAIRCNRLFAWTYFLHPCGISASFLTSSRLNKSIFLLLLSKFSKQLMISFLNA